MLRWLVSAAVLVAVPAAAQDPCGLAAVPRAKGQFAAYDVKAANGTNRMTMAFLGTEDRAGRKLERLQMEMTLGGGRMGGQAVLQMLVPAWPFASADIGEIVVQVEGRPPMLLPPQMFAMMQSRGGSQPAFEIARTCGDAKLVGEEKVTVPAGTFTAKRYKSEQGGGEFWVSGDVGTFGLVKAVMKEGSMELAAKGSGATSKLVGEPMEMPMMGPPPGGRP